MRYSAVCEKERKKERDWCACRRLRTKYSRAKRSDCFKWRCSKLSFASSHAFETRILLGCLKNFNAKWLSCSHKNTVLTLCFAKENMDLGSLMFQPLVIGQSSRFRLQQKNQKHRSRTIDVKRCCLCRSVTRTRPINSMLTFGQDKCMP